MDHRETFEGVAALLTERGYWWVVQHVREEMATGKLVEERLSTLSEVATRQMPLVNDLDFKKGKSAEFVRRVEYQPKEALILLLEAARRATCDAAMMAGELQTFLFENKLSVASFQPETADQGASTLTLAAANRSNEAAATWASKLDAIIAEVKAN